MTTAEEHTRGWALAPARLAREDVVTLRKLYTATHAVRSANINATFINAVLHVDREDDRKLALAKLGRPAPHVLVRATVSENAIDVGVYAVKVDGDGDPSASAQVAHHKFRRTTPVNEWTRILGRHCRHAFGVLAHLRAPTLAQVFARDDGVSKVR